MKFIHILRRLWYRLTYWPVPCADCRGTGVCATTQAGAPPSVPHSCCGECGRKIVPASALPAGYSGVHKDGTAVVGDGVMWRRPWSRRQVRRPG